MAKPTEMEPLRYNADTGKVEGLLNGVWQELEKIDAAWKDAYRVSPSPGGEEAMLEINTTEGLLTYMIPTAKSGIVVRPREMQRAPTGKKAPDWPVTMPTGTGVAPLSPEEEAKKTGKAPTTAQLALPDHHYEPDPSGSGEYIQVPDGYRAVVLPSVEDLDTGDILPRKLDYVRDPYQPLPAWRQQKPLTLEQTIEGYITQLLAEGDIKGATAWRDWLQRATPQQKAQLELQERQRQDIQARWEYEQAQKQATAQQKATAQEMATAQQQAAAEATARRAEQTAQQQAEQEAYNRAITERSFGVSQAQQQFQNQVALQEQARADWAQQLQIQASPGDWWTQMRLLRGQQPNIPYTGQRVVPLPEWAQRGQPGLPAGQAGAFPQLGGSQVAREAALLPQLMGAQRGTLEQLPPPGFGGLSPAGQVPVPKGVQPFAVPVMAPKRRYWASKEGEERVEIAREDIDLWESRGWDVEVADTQEPTQPPKTLPPVPQPDFTVTPEEEAAARAAWTERAALQFQKLPASERFRGTYGYSPEEYQRRYPEEYEQMLRPPPKVGEGLPAWAPPQPARARSPYGDLPPAPQPARALTPYGYPQGSQRGVAGQLPEQGLRQAFGGQPVGQARQLPSLGAPPFPSAQSWANLVPAEQAMFGSEIANLGFYGPDYRRQWEATLPSWEVRRPYSRAYPSIGR